MARKKSKIEKGKIPPLLKSQKAKLEQQKADKENKELEARKAEFRASQKAKYSSGTTVRRTGPENRAAAIGQSPAKPYSQPIRVTGPKSRLDVLPQFKPTSSQPIRSTGQKSIRYVMEGKITFDQFLDKIENID